MQIARLMLYSSQLVNTLIVEHLNILLQSAE